MTGVAAHDGIRWLGALGAGRRWFPKARAHRASGARAPVVPRWGARSERCAASGDSAPVLAPRGALWVARSAIAVARIALLRAIRSVGAGGGPCKPPVAAARAQTGTQKPGSPSPVGCIRPSQAGAAIKTVRASPVGGARAGAFARGLALPLPPAARCAAVTDGVPGHCMAPAARCRMHPGPGPGNCSGGGQGSRGIGSRPVAALVLALFVFVGPSLALRAAGAQSLPDAAPPETAIPAASAAAPAVRVRGGEHADFTRLVFRIGDGMPWELHERAGGADLRVGDDGGRFDLSEAFARIPRTRLRDLHPLDGGGLRLELACACPLRAFEDLPGMLVVDILAPPLADPLPAPPRPPRPPRDATVPPGATHAQDTAASAGRALAEDLRRRNLEAAAGSGSPDMDAALDPLRRALLDTVDAAVAEGRLAPSATLTDPLPGPVIGPSSAPSSAPVAVPDPQATRDPDSAAPAPAPGTAAPPAAHEALSRPGEPDIPQALAAQIAAQLRIGAAGSDEPVAAEHCLAEATFAVPDWGDGRPVAAQLAARRAALLGEFDRPDAAAVAALARLYLHLGFGAEMRALLRAFPVALPDADVLRALSHLVDGERPAHPGRLLAQADCPGPGALWAVLAAPEPGALVGVDEVAVRRAFADLPAHLRRALGPALVSRLLDMGATESMRVVAEAARRAALRADAPETVALDLALARLDPAGSAAPGVSARGSGASGLRHAPEALLLELDRARAQGLPADPDLAALAGALSVEHRGTALGHDLLRAQARTLAAAARPDEAFAVARDLERADTGAAPEAVAALRGDLFAALADVAPDDRFVAVIFAERPWDGPVMDGAAWLAMAGRMADLGFPRHARLLLAGDDPAFGGVAAAMIRARSHLSEGALAAAAAALDGIAPRTDEEAEALVRLQERLAAGGYGPAAAPAAPPPDIRDAPATDAPDRAPDGANALAPRPSAAPVAVPPVADRPLSTLSPGPSPTTEHNATGDAHRDGTGGLLHRSRDALATSTALRGSIEVLLQDGE